MKPGNSGSMRILFFLDEKEYDRQRIENLADTMGLQIERNKITLDSSEKEIEDDIFRLIAGCYLIYFLHYFMELL